MVISPLIASSNALENLGADRHRHHPPAQASRAVRTSIPPSVALFGARRRRVGAGVVPEEFGLIAASADGTRRFGGIAAGVWRAT